MTMEWNEVVDYLSSRTKLHVLNLEDIKELSRRLEVDSLSPNKFINGNNVGEVFKEVLNTYYYYKSHGKNGFAIESMIEEMKKVQRLERLTAELRAYYLTKLRIKQQIPITPFKKADQKKSQMYSLSLEENSEIAQLRSEVAELRQKINESTSGINRVPSSPRPPIRRKQSNTPERTSAAQDSKSLDQISKILLDHDVCISDQKKTLARMTKLCLGALSAIAKLENKILKSDFGNHCSDSESNLISIWENTHKQLKKEIIETKTELSSIAEKVSHCPNGNIGRYNYYFLDCSTVDMKFGPVIK
nr:uncharacterized protein LOC121132339 [Lepeophtheirus salmonis]